MIWILAEVEHQGTGTSGTMDNLPNSSKDLGDWVDRLQSLVAATSSQSPTHVCCCSFMALSGECWTVFHVVCDSRPPSFSTRRSHPLPHAAVPKRRWSISGICTVTSAFERPAICPRIRCWRVPTHTLDCEPLLQTPVVQSDARMARSATQPNRPLRATDPASYLINKYH